MAEKNIKSVAFSVCMVAAIFIAAGITVTCSMFGDSQEIPDPDWKTVCLKKPWKPIIHNAQADTTIPLCFTTFTDLLFSSVSDNYVITVRREDGNTGPFEFTFTSEDSGKLLAFQNGINATLTAVFSVKEDKNTLTLTIPDGNRIVLNQQ